MADYQDEFKRILDEEVGDYAARALAAGGGLRIEEAPFPIVPAKLSLVWRAAQDQDPGERWLRGEIIRFMGEPAA